MNEIIGKLFAEQGLLVAFVTVGALILASEGVSRFLTAGRIHASAIAIVAALVLAWVGGEMTGGKKGFADVPAFAGLALLGGNMAWEAAKYDMVKAPPPTPAPATVATPDAKAPVKKQ